MSILILDDSQDFRDLLKSFLNKKGYNDILLTENAEQAYTVLGIGEDSESTNNVDLILLDLKMPETNGIEVLKRIRSNVKYRDIPIIVITASTDDEDIEAAFLAGAFDYITKPLRKIELYLRVRSALLLKRERDRRSKRAEKLRGLSSELRRKNNMLKELSSIDHLTGLANRRIFEEYFNTIWKTSVRNNQEISLIMVDIDFFKLYNDTYGHQMGDRCLKHVADVINHTVHRSIDMAARYGGEEFIVLLPDTDKEGVRIVAERIRQGVIKLDEEHRTSKVRDVVTLSVGVATGKSVV